MNFCHFVNTLFVFALVYFTMTDSMVLSLPAVVIIAPCHLSGSARDWKGTIVPYAMMICHCTGGRVDGSWLCISIPNSKLRLLVLLIRRVVIGSSNAVVLLWG
jgi:hypothetical protein